MGSRLSRADSCSAEWQQDGVPGRGPAVCSVSVGLLVELFGFGMDFAIEGVSVAPAIGSQPENSFKNSSLRSSPIDKSNKLRIWCNFHWRFNCFCTAPPFGEKEKGEIWAQTTRFHQSGWWHCLHFINIHRQTDGEKAAGQHFKTTFLIEVEVKITLKPPTWCLTFFILPCADVEHNSVFFYRCPTSSLWHSHAGSSQAWRMTWWTERERESVCMRERARDSRLTVRLSADQKTSLLSSSSCSMCGRTADTVTFTIFLEILLSETILWAPLLPTKTCS